MSSNNFYDVTEWTTGNPYNDIGEVINSIIADIKSRQTNADVNEGETRCGDLYPTRRLSSFDAGCH